MADRYSIYIEGVEKFSDLTQFEYFDIMEDLAIEFYQTGKPNPSDIHTEIIYMKKITFKRGSDKTRKGDN